MRISDIEYAMDCAQEFIVRAKLVVANDDTEGDIICGNRRTGSVRRASLELTRALATMRAIPSKREGM